MNPSISELLNFAGIHPDEVDRVVFERNAQAEAVRRYMVAKAELSAALRKTMTDGERVALANEVAAKVRATIPLMPKPLPKPPSLPKPAATKTPKPPQPTAEQKSGFRWRDTRRS